ncbi:immunity protein Imm33 domain-containing protein [Nocardiopsis algeriensis]|uniref:Imm33-like domain-containing protein n=1 Tax=Nocardiopsis algeriensis TaxID=1478215 RepID=A0A841IHZ4_9ACTN|nr:hypothetical protein [Nocardiopsis algeriensis]MBB6118379.1 hypothetical protein [Nocardiopsis algeriensis]
MATTTREVSGRTVSVTADDALSPQVDRFFGVLHEIPAESFGDGLVFRAGWSAYSLAGTGTALTVRCPDYVGDVTSDTENLSLALAVDAQQAHVLSLAGVAAGKPAVFNEKVVLSEGALTAPRVVAQRSAPSGTGDSGWFVGTEGEDFEGVDSLEAVHVYQLLELRPSLLQALALPEGYLASFGDDTLEVVLDASDRVAYERPR